MTEAEMKTKLCCGPPLIALMLAIRSDPADALKLGGNCLGSKCSAWRWTHGGPSDPPHSGDPGYCGLAGKP